MPDANDLTAALAGVSEDELRDLVEGLPVAAAQALLDDLRGRVSGSLPGSPVELAETLDFGFRTRDHLDHLSERIIAAVADVEAGRNRRLIVTMPPRTGKTTLATLLSSAWVLQRHPSWPTAVVSHDSRLATSWGRTIRRWVEAGKLGDGVELAGDAGAAGMWETTAGGRFMALSTRESLTGRGVKVLLIDDPIKDFVDAHSAVMRQNLWDWWLSVAQTRLEPPFLVMACMTRWHESDLIGRLKSPEYEGDPSQWEEIRLPAVAEDTDPLGRAPGEPLLSPLLNETPEQATARWAEVRRSVGEYVWAGMYQQRPSPAKGSIFDVSWWRFWTSDPGRVTADGRVVYLDPETLTGGRWLDSWDTAFSGKETPGASGSTSYVVGQRWVRSGPNRYLIAQQRDRWTFTQTLTRFERWARTDDPVGSPCGWLVHLRLVEEKANGAAILDVMHRKVAGLKAVKPVTSKEARARSVTPEIESGHVYLPHPADPGNEWVTDALSELREFPSGAHDDVVDGLTQALTELRDAGRGSLTVPGRAEGVTQVTQIGRRRLG